MKRGLPFLLAFMLAGFLLLSFTSCSTDSREEITGVSAEIIPKSLYQHLSSYDLLTAYNDEKMAITLEFNGYINLSYSQYVDDLITYEEFLARKEELEAEGNAALEAVDIKYQAMGGLWSSLDVEFAVDCDNPSSTDAIIVLDVTYPDGTNDTLLGYPDPLLPGREYHEEVTFRTNNYVDTINDMKFVTR